MAQSPQTTVKVYINKYIDKTYNNILNFTSTQERDAFFASSNVTLLKSYEDMQYLRKDSFVDIEALYDEVQNANYIIYDNNEGYGKHYAFITSIEFLNFNCTRLYYTTDLYNDNLSAILFGNQKVVYERHHDNPFAYTNLINDTDLMGTIPVTSDLCYTSRYYMMVLFTERSKVTGGTDSGQRAEQLIPLIWICNSKGVAPSPVTTSLDDIRNMLLSPYIYCAYICEIPVETHNFIYNDVHFQSTKCTILESTKTLYVMSTTDMVYDFTISNISLMNPTLLYPTEYKLNTYPFSFYRIQSNETTIDIGNNLLGDSPKYSIRYLISTTGIQIEYTIYNGSGYYKLYDKSIAPLTQYDNKGVQYVASNKYSLYNTLVLGAFKVGTGALMAGAGALARTPSPNAITSANLPVPTTLDDTVSYSTPNASMIKGGIQRAISGAKEISGTLRMLKDMYASPLEGNPSGDYYNSRLFVPIGNLRITHYGLNSTERNKALMFYSMYGYKTVDNDVFKLRRRKYYDYVKTINYVFIGNCEPNEKSDIERIFNNGVSLWHYNGGDFLKFGDYPNNSKNVVV